MKWQDLRQSGNIEDRRGMGGGFGGGMGGMSFRTGGLGLGGLLVVALISWVFGIDPTQFFSSDTSAPNSGVSGPLTPGAADPVAKFASSILADTEDTWTAILAQQGRRYTPPVMVLFSDAAESACGMASTAVGPFYCPEDHKVYLDLAFFHDLDQRFGAPGDFAQAYVIAHEVGHHVQNLFGILRESAGLSRSAANAQSVQTELQADCLAGVWGNSAAQRNLLEPGDVEEGLNAAAAVGDDRIQRRTQGRVVPDSFTHGSSADRVAAFKRGYAGGGLSSCGISR